MGSVLFIPEPASVSHYALCALALMLAVAGLSLPVPRKTRTGSSCRLKPLPLLALPVWSISLGMRQSNTPCHPHLQRWRLAEAALHRP